MTQSITTNAQEDIIGLFDGTGTQVVSYTYNSWGKLIDISGTLASTIGVKNPYRYRGYRYDSETGLYYLQSRYYDPVTSRYLNADVPKTMLLQPDDLLGTNLFVYCANNPVMNVDPTGYFWVRVAIAVASGAIFGAIAYSIGRSVGLSGKTLTAFTAAFVGVGVTIGLIWGVKILTQVNNLIKPLLYFFSNPKTVYFGMKVLGLIQFEVHRPHHNKPIHFVIRWFFGKGGFKDWWFGK